MLLVLLFIVTGALPGCMTNQDPEAATNEQAMKMWDPENRKVSAAHLFLEGSYALQKGNFSAAARLFETAYSQDASPHIVVKLIESQTAAGMLDEAYENARRASLVYPSSGNIYGLYGDILARRGLLEKAIQNLEKAIELEPTSARPYLVLIGIYDHLKQPHKGIAIANAMVTALPNRVEGFGLLAKLLLTTKQHRKALQPAERAYQLNQRNPEIILLYALALEYNNRSEDSVHLYEMLFRLDPTNSDLVGTMVNLYRSIGNLEEAYGLLVEAEKSSPQGVSPGIKMQQAFVLWELKRFQEAQKHMEELAKEYPKVPRLAYMHGLASEKTGQNDKALAVYSSITSDSPYFHHAQYRAIQILNQADRFEEAFALAMEVARSKHHASAQFYQAAVNLLDKRGHYKRATEILEEGTKRHTENSHLLFLLGIFQEKNKQIDSCIATMKQVIEVDPKHSSAYNYLAYLYAERGIKLDEAEDYVSIALSIKPKEGHYLDTLGWIYYKKGNYQKAEQVLLTALKRLPDEGVILEHLGEVYLKLGFREKGIQYLKDALEKRLDKRDKKRILKRISILENSNAS